MYESLSPVQTDEIIAVIYATYAVAKRKPEKNSGREKNQACKGLEPLTSAIRVRRSTN